MATVLAIASASACLELNPEYVDDTPAETSAVDTTNDDTTNDGTTNDATTAGPGSDSGSQGASTNAVDGSSSGEPVDCSPDPFDPNTFEEPADAGDGLTGARLEGVDDEDWYKTAMDPAGRAEVYARTTNDDVRVCFFAECDGGIDTEITKCAGEPAVAPNWLPGCCDNGSVGLEYDCGGPTAITVFARVDEGGDTCPIYDIEFGFFPL